MIQNCYQTLSKLFQSAHKQKIKKNTNTNAKKPNTYPIPLVPPVTRAVIP